MQELVSFISIMLGVIVLTAWVMWLLLRPSGDSKTKEFASESARDGLTLTVIENNDLKNKITRLERELKVLMSAGYGKTAEERGKGKGEKIKGKGEKIKRKGERGKGKGKKLKAKDGGLKAEVVVTAAKPVVEKEPAEVVVPKPVVEKEPAEAVVAKPVVEKESAEVAAPKPVVEKEPTEAVVPRSAEMIASSEVAPLSEAQRITDEAEKKKIADYLASVAETTERQMKEVEALDEEEKALEKPGKYPDDDLRKIKGIGPHLEGKLKKAGISSYQQIAEFTDEDIAQISRQIGFFPRRINRDRWVEQARVLVGKG